MGKSVVLHMLMDITDFTQPYKVKDLPPMELLCITKVVTTETETTTILTTMLTEMEDITNNIYAY